MDRSRETGIGAALLGLILAGVFFAAHAEGINLEATGGQCNHRLAPDASWHYEYGGYQNKMRLNTNCLQLGISVLPYEWDGVKWGFRAAYVSLGSVRADNTYPTDEPAYFRAKDSGTPVQSATGRYQGNGSTKGFTFGLAAEEERFGLRLGAEVGLAVLRSTWHVDYPDGRAIAGCRGDWACADSTHATYYFGVNARYKYLFLSVRQYANAHASNAKANPLFVGPTTGPVTSVTLGVSVAL